MRTFLAALLLPISLAATSKGRGDDDCKNGAWDQCGGEGWTGDTCCPAGYDCTVENDWYSGCALEDLCLVVQFGQCDGIDEDGNPWPDDQKCCPDSFECEYQSEYYSQCVEVGVNDTGCADVYTQCGGNDWNGTTTCCSGSECTFNNEWYSGCTYIPVCTNPAYGQCGGVDSDGNPWLDNHDSCCPDGFACFYSSEFYSQCLENTTTTKPRLGHKEHVQEQQCTSDADCNSQVSTAKCVVESEWYSACADCADDSFAEECKYWSGDFLLAAESTCGQTSCDGRCPGGSDDECSSSTTGSTCVSSTSFDSCMDCSNQTTFDSQCYSLSDENVVLAQDACGLSCTYRCPTHSDDECPTDKPTCVVQADQSWEACISCDSDAFQAECTYWSSQFRSAAEQVCDETCTSTSA